MIALVTGSHVEPCPWCRKPTGFVEFRKGETRWTRIEPHNCKAITTLPEGTALSDLVDEHEEGGIGA